MPTRTSEDTLEGPCQHCGQRYVPWITPDAVWNSVMGGEGGLLCPTCFCLEADLRSGTRTMIWRLEIRA